MIDPITVFVSSLSLSWLTPLAVILDEYGYPLMVAFFLLMLWRFKDKRKVLVLTMVFVAIATLGLKVIVDAPRPCQAGIEASIASKITCPIEPSFPSGHSSAAFGLASASLGNISSYALWPFAVLMAFTRLYLGVHTLIDLVGAFVVGLGCYGLALVAERRFLKKRIRSKV